LIPGRPERSSFRGRRSFECQAEFFKRIDPEPSVLIDEQHLIQGGQPVEVFEQALRRLGVGQVA